MNQALARSPNKNQVKVEIKYKIPERWTKKFHKFDVVPMSIYTQGGVQEERGRVNKQLQSQMKVVQEYEKMQQHP